MFALTQDQIKKIPKVELHCHLELVFRPASLVEYARWLNLDFPQSVKDIESKIIIREPMKDLASVLESFLAVQRLLASPEILERHAYEACAYAAEQNIRIVEFRYAPTFIQQGHENLRFDDIHRAICRGIERGKKDFKIAVGLIGIIQRISSYQQAAQVTEFIIDNKDTFIGMDLADNEVGFDCKKFASLFEKAKSEGLHITVHAGEANVPAAPQYVRDAINYLGAQRIGHGIQIARDPLTVQFVREKRILLEVCPTSNFLTNAISASQEHPARSLVDAGIFISINTDDPSMFGIDLNHEYNRLVREHRFSESLIHQCNDWAASCSFIPHSEKQKVWPRMISDSLVRSS